MNEFIIIDTPRAEALTPEEARRWENTVRTCENLLETVRTPSLLVTY